MEPSPALDSQRLLCITDLHGRLAMLSKILAAAGPVDVILLGGDITNFGSPSDADKAIDLARRSAPRVFAVAGNCDSADIDRRLVELGVSLSGRGAMCNSLALCGVSAMPPWKTGMYQFTEEHLTELLHAGLGEVNAPRRVVLAHAPPRDTALDRTIFGQHVGSIALRQFIERAEPDLVVCGHIHEGRGVERIGRTTVVNCGHAAVGEYALADVGQQVNVALHTAYRES